MAARYTLHANDAEAFITLYGRPIRSQPEGQRTTLVYKTVADEEDAGHGGLTKAQAKEADELMEKVNIARQEAGNPSQPILEVNSQGEPVINVKKSAAPQPVGIAVNEEAEKAFNAPLKEPEPAAKSKGTKAKKTTTKKAATKTKKKGKK